MPYPAAIFADDGEKIRRLARDAPQRLRGRMASPLFRGVAERADRLTTMTFGEYVSVAPPRGTVYLPTCSYTEMGEWVLPPRNAARFGDLLHELRAGKMAEMKPFLQGGYFRNFLRKYDESNQLHKRMLWVSERVAAARRKRPVHGRAACDFLYRAQSNDVYWHGVFGALPQPPARGGVRESPPRRGGVRRGPARGEGTVDRGGARGHRPGRRGGTAPEDVGADPARPRP